MPRSATFARIVERRLEHLLRRPVVFSPRDWRLVADWHARGIPVALVLETMDEVASRKKGTPPRSLSYFARAVEEGWQAILEGKTLTARDPRTEGPGPGADPAAPWDDAVHRGGLPESLADLLRELMRRLRAGEEPRTVDESLDEALGVRAYAPEAYDLAEAEALAALSGYERRMTAAAWSRTLRRAVTDRMRVALGLPRAGAGSRML